MAVEAARDCLAGTTRAAIGSLAFASTTHAVRRPLAMPASSPTALDLGESLRTRTSAGSQRAGVGALLAGARAGCARPGDALVVAADRRLAKAGSEQECTFGHGAAALLRRARAPTSRPSCSATRRCRPISSTTIAPSGARLRLRARGALGARRGLPEARAARDRGCAGACRHRRQPHVRHFVAAGPGAVRAPRSRRRAASRAEAVAGRPARGVRRHGRGASAAAARRRARDGQRPARSSCWPSFGQGCDALVLRATGSPRPRRAAAAAARSPRGVSDGEYVRFLANCGLVDIDWGMRAERDNRTAQSVAWRKHRDVTAFVGGRCTPCGTVQFPRSRACVNPDCRALRHAGGSRRSRNRPARVKTFTEDWLAVHAQPAARLRQRGARRRRQRVHRVHRHAAGDARRRARRCASSSASRTSTRVRGFRRYFWKATPVRN